MEQCIVNIDESTCDKSVNDLISICYVRVRNL